MAAAKSEMETDAEQKSVSPDGKSTTILVDNSYPDIFIVPLEKQVPGHVLRKILDLLALERLEIIINEQKDNSDAAKLMIAREEFYGHQFIDPEEFDSFANFKTEFLNLYWEFIHASISNEINQTFVEIFSRCYLAESLVAIGERKFLLLKHLYPDMTLEETLANFAPPVNVAASIVRAVYETEPLQADDPLGQIATAIQKYTKVNRVYLRNLIDKKRLEKLPGCCPGVA